MTSRRPDSRSCLACPRFPAGPAPITAARKSPLEARPEDVAAPVEQSMVDAAIYRDGIRIDSPATVADAVRRLAAEPGAFGWIGLFRPAAAQFLPGQDPMGSSPRCVHSTGPRSTVGAPPKGPVAEAREPPLIAECLPLRPGRTLPAKVLGRGLRDRHPVFDRAKPRQ